MKNSSDRRLVGAATFLACMLILSACSGGATPTTAEVVTVEPTLWLTTHVTQIVATSLPPPPTQIPTSTPWPTATLDWDPWAVPIYYPLFNCSGSRLHIGDMAFVGSLSLPIKISLTNQVFYDPGIRDLEHGETMQVIDGPDCVDGYVVWRVFTSNDGIEGYVPEGDGEQYWLFPLSPTFPTPDRD